MLIISKNHKKKKDIVVLYFYQSPIRVASVKAENGKTGARSDALGEVTVCLRYVMRPLCQVERNPPKLFPHLLVNVRDDMSHYSGLEERIKCEITPSSP